MKRMDSRFGILVVVAVLLSAIVEVGVASDFQPSPQNEEVLYVEEVNDTGDISGEVVAFDELSSDQQQVFERALDDPRRESRGYGSTHTDVAWNYDVGGVRYQNSTYAVSVAAY